MQWIFVWIVILERLQGCASLCWPDWVQPMCVPYCCTAMGSLLVAGSSRWPGRATPASAPLCYCHRLCACRRVPVCVLYQPPIPIIDSSPLILPTSRLCVCVFVFVRHVDRPWPLIACKMGVRSPMLQLRGCGRCVPGTEACRSFWATWHPIMEAMYVYGSGQAA